MKTSRFVPWIQETINSKVFMEVCIVILFGMMTIGFVLGYTIYYQYSTLSLLFENMPPDMHSISAINIAHEREAFFIRLITGLLPVIFCLCIIIIFLTQRITGPLSRLKDAFKAIAQNESLEYLIFREKDILHDVARAFNAMVSDLKTKEKVRAKLLKTVHERIEGLAEIVSRENFTKEEVEPLLLSLKETLSKLENTSPPMEER